MLPFATSFLVISASFFAPAFLGLIIMAAAARFAKPAYLAAFSVGIYLWFFADTLGGSASLDVNAGFSGGLTQTVLFCLFALGLLLMFSLDNSIFASGQDAGRLGFTIPLLVAFAVGIHGFGEGAAFSSTAAATASSDLLKAFGGTSSAVAFVLHKTLEPMMVGAVYWAYDKERARGTAGLLKDTFALALAFAIPGIIGGATDYFLNYDTTYGFALGLGASIYAAARLSKPLFTGASPSRRESVSMAVLALIGFTCIYVAALLHS